MYRLFVTGDLGFEFWMDIPGYEGLYQASTYGRVRSYDWYDVLGRRHKGRILKPGRTTKGYLQVSLGRNNKTSVHRLVALTFLPKRIDQTCVDHKDTDRENCRVENLRWCTYTENRLNPITYTRGSMAVVQKNIDGTVVNVFPSMSDAERFGYDQTSISRCCAGILKHHKGYIWEYLS